MSYRNGTSPSPSLPEAPAAEAPFLLFDSRGALCGLPAGAVREVLLLPEIAPIEGARFWVGVLDVRGRLVPIVDPGEISGGAPRRLELSDSVIVVEGDDGRSVGLIVEGVRDVRTLGAGAIEVLPAGATPGVARVDGELVRLPSLAFLLGFAAREKNDPAPARPFCPDVSPAERAVFAERARALRAPTSSGATSVATTGALVALRLGGETFGVPLDWVREFATKTPVTPVPGGPSDLLGLVNRRGEVVPLLDLRVALGLSTQGDAGEAIAFLDGRGTTLALAVEEVLGVFSPLEGELLPPPATNAGEAVHAAARYGNRTIGVLDLEHLLERGGWLDEARR